MTQPTDTPTPDEGDMPATIDFRSGVRGQFYSPDAVFTLPADTVEIPEERTQR